MSADQLHKHKLKCWIPSREWSFPKANLLLNSQVPLQLWSNHIHVLFMVKESMRQGFDFLKVCRARKYKQTSRSKDTNKLKKWSTPQAWTWLHVVQKAQGKNAQTLSCSLIFLSSSSIVSWAFSRLYISSSFFLSASLKKRSKQHSRKTSISSYTNFSSQTPSCYHPTQKIQMASRHDGNTGNTSHNAA